MSSHVSAPSSRSLLVRLDREWRVIAHRPAVLARARRWELGVPFASLDDVVVAAGFRVRHDDRLVDAPSADAGEVVLAALVRAARSDDLAARVVLQRLLPGLVACARRWARRVDGSTDAIDEVLAAAWGVIRTYAVDRRPHHLAANLLRDAEYHAFIRPTRRLGVHEPTAPHLLDLPMEQHEHTDAATELAELLASARTLSERDLLLAGLLVRGSSAVEMAEVLRVSLRTVTNHREALVHRLRQAAREMAAA